MVHAPLSLHQCFSFGLCSCLKGVPLKNGEFRTTWLHCNHPAQVTALHDDVIPTIACLPLCLLVTKCWLEWGLVDTSITNVSSAMPNHQGHLV